MDIVALELIRQLQQLDKYNEYFVFVKPDEDRGGLTETPNFKFIEIAGVGGYPVWEQWSLARAAEPLHLDLLHCTSNTAPLNLSVPLVLTLHDIIYLEQVNLRQGTWYQRLGNLYRRWNVPQVAHIASRVLTVSAFECARIQDRLQLDEGKLGVVYNGVGRHFFQEPPAAELEQLRQHFGLPTQFMLFLGNTDPKKNLRGVLLALGQLAAQGSLQMPLVLLDFTKERLRSVLSELNLTHLEPSIHLCGYVQNSKLPLLYRLATLFLYPSLRESFGIPILEAMACGTPVITSNTSSMPEVAGEAALLVDPNQPEQLSQAIQKLLQDPDLYNRLSTLGLHRSQSFSWRRSAEQMLEEYKKVAGVKEQVYASA
ncbi:glycosyltransferase family 1 protein [Pontibacter oryzae]|uniref:Glycosyltransferase family 1 protein n=2 Tax=Pontibacter oryzae TaxID=2304593 RepID=A0A399SMX6_9BACT|nr:glycosyltransferase family 1 protein [Pontibacter oryzae]